MNRVATFLRESKNARFFIPLGIILIVVSIFLFISDNHNKDYIKTEATISKVVLVKEESYDAEGNHEEAMYDIFVKYVVDGNEYETLLGEMYEHKVGEKIDIVYNPENPKEISQPASMILNIVLLVGGVASITGGTISIINNINKNRKMKEQEKRWKNGK